MLGDDLSSLVARSSDQTEHPSEAVLVDVVFEGKAGCGVELFHHRTEALLRRPVLGTLRGLLSDLHRRAEAQGHFARCSAAAVPIHGSSGPCCDTLCQHLRSQASPPTAHG